MVFQHAAALQAHITDHTARRPNWLAGVQVMETDSGLFRGPNSPGWQALQILLLRGDVCNAEVLTLLRTCKDAAHLALASANRVNLTLNKSRRRRSPYTARLLQACSADSSGPAPDVHLSLRGRFLHCLPAHLLSALTLERIALGTAQWQQLLTQLGDYSRLHTLRLRDCSCKDAPADTVAPTPPPTLHIQHLEVYNGSGGNLKPIAPAISGAVADHCKSFSAPASLYAFPFLRNVNFALALRTLTLVIDRCTNIDLCQSALYLLSSLRHVTLTFLSLDETRHLGYPKPRVKQPDTPWQSLTLSGYVPYKILAYLPVKTCSKVTVRGHVYTPYKTSLPDADAAVQSCPSLCFAPVPNRSDALRAAGCGDPVTLHLYSPDAATLQIILKCLSQDVECLTFHADHKDPAFTASALRVLSQSLPTHVTKLGLILDSSKGPARILSYVHIVHHQIQIPVPADHVPAPPHVHMEVVPFHHMLQDFQQMLQHIQAIQPQAQPPPAEPQPAAGDDGGEQQAAPQQPQPGALQQALQLLGLQALPPQVLQFLQLLGQQVQQALQEAEDEPDQEQMTAFLQTRLLLPLLPSHVGTLCIEVVNKWNTEYERLSEWHAVIFQLAYKYNMTRPVTLVLANVALESGHANPTAGSVPPWLPEEKGALLEWRDHNTGNDGHVAVSFV